MPNLVRRDATGRVYQHGDEYTRTAVSTNTTIDKGQQIVGCTTHSITVTLASSIVRNGGWVVVTDESGAAGGVGQAITIDTEGSETINGSSTISLNANYESVHLYCDGTNWMTVAAAGSVL